MPAIAEEKKKVFRSEPAETDGEDELHANCDYAARSNFSPRWWDKKIYELRFRGGAQKHADACERRAGGAARSSSD